MHWMVSMAFRFKSFFMSQSAIHFNRHHVHVFALHLFLSKALVTFHFNQATFQPHKYYESKLKLKDHRFVEELCPLCTCTADFIEELPFPHRRYTLSINGHDLQGSALVGVDKSLSREPHIGKLSLPDRCLPTTSYPI